MYDDVRVDDKVNSIFRGVGSGLVFHRIDISIEWVCSIGMGSSIGVVSWDVYRNFLLVVKGAMMDIVKNAVQCTVWITSGQAWCALYLSGKSESYGYYERRYFF
jgi:hypothetical protein